MYNIKKVLDQSPCNFLKKKYMVKFLANSNVDFKCKRMESQITKISVLSIVLRAMSSNIDSTYQQHFCRFIGFFSQGYWK